MPIGGKGINVLKNMRKSCYIPPYLRIEIKIVRYSLNIGKLLQFPDFCIQVFGFIFPVLQQVQPICRFGNFHLLQDHRKNTLIKITVPKYLQQLEHAVFGPEVLIAYN